MNVQLTVVQLWALVAGGPIAMVLTVLVGILVNNAVAKSNVEGLKSNMEGLKSDLRRVETTLKTDIQRVESTLKADIQRVESTLRSEIQRVEGVLSAKIDTLTLRVKILEEEIHTPLVK